MNKYHFLISPRILLLILLLMVLFIVPFFPESLYAIMYHGLFTGIVLTSVYVLRKGRRFNLIIALSVVFIKWSILFYDAELRNQSNIPQLIFFAYIVGRLLVQIANIRQSGTNVIVDSLNGYFLSALVSALLIGITANLSKGSFTFAEVAETPVQGMNDYIYHALVVFSTTGFGDIVPMTPEGKVVSNFISVTGQLYVAIIITLLIGHYTTQPRNKE